MFFDEVDCQVEMVCNVFDGCVVCDKCGKSLGFIGWVYGEVVEIFGEVGFDGGFGVVFED